MNKLKFLPFLCLSVMLFAFTSCENEGTTPEPSIEGIWKCIEPDEQDQIYIVFNSDKTGIHIEGAVGYKINVDHFLYTYDSEKKVLTITSDDESYDVSVQKLTSTQLVTILGDDDCLTFSRYNGTINDLEELFDIDFTSCENEGTTPDPSIEGIWKCIEPDEQDQIYIVFNSDKTGIHIEGAVGYKINVDHFLYTYDSEKKVLTITSDDESYDVSVQKLTSTQLVTILGDDDCLTFSRYNGTINDLEELFDIEL